MITHLTKKVTYFSCFVFFVALNCVAFGATLFEKEEKYRSSFPGVNHSQLMECIRSDKTRVKVPIDGNRLVGYNINATSLFQHKLYENVKNSTSDCGPDKILEIGCGRGYMSVRLALLGAKVDAIELSALALKKTPTLCERYAKIEITAGYESYPVNFENHDILDPVYSLKSQEYDKALIMNVLHFMSPYQAIETLKKIRSSLKDQNSRIFITMDTCSVWKIALDQYLKAKDEGTPFPGYMKLYSAIKVWRDQPELVHEIIGLICATETDTVNDLRQNLGLKSFQEKVDGPFLISTQFSEFFHGDTESMNILLKESGLEAESLNYECEDDGMTYETLTPEILRFYAERQYQVKLNVIAKNCP